jgi:hypothetical protein
MRRLLIPLLFLAGACGAMGGGDTPVVGKKRAEVCDAVKSPPAFYCPSGTIRRGKPPPDGTEMWCERKGGIKHGPYRRFPPSAQGAGEPDFTADNVVVGAYAEDKQDGAWWTRRQGASTVSVAFYQNGELAQRIQCHQ